MTEFEMTEAAKLVSDEPVKPVELAKPVELLNELDNTPTAVADETISDETISEDTTDVSFTPTGIEDIDGYKLVTAVLKDVVVTMGTAVELI